MERLKIKIHSKEHSEAVQKGLFELDFEWGAKEEKKDSCVWVIQTPDGQFIMDGEEQAFKIKGVTISFKTIEQLSKMPKPLTWK